MQLSSIHSLECPACGCATIIQESIAVDSFGKVKQHVNGQMWESRRFLCGCQIDWIPNFEREEQSKFHECTRTTHYKDRELKRAAAKKSIEEFINTLDIDDAAKKTLRWSLL